MTQDDQASKTQAAQADDRSDVPIPLGMEHADIAAVAFHDVICPEGEHCRSRLLHARSHPLVYSGILERYDDQTWKLCLSFARHVAKTQTHTCGDASNTQDSSSD